MKLIFQIQLSLLIYIKLCSDGCRWIFQARRFEKRLGLPVSFNCDRETVLLSQSHLGFIGAIVMPLFSVINEFFPGIKFTLQNINNNEKYFQGVKEKTDKKKTSNEIIEEEEDKNENSEDSNTNDNEDNSSVI